MKKYIIFILAVSVVISAYSQIGVEIIVDSPATMIDRFNQYLDRLKMIQETIQQVQLANSMVQNQIKTIEKLGQGDFSGFVEAFNYQTQTINQFSTLVDDSFTAYLSSQDTRDLMKNDDFINDTQNFQNALSSLKENMTASNDFLRQSLRLVNNTKARMNAQKGIVDKSAETDSLTGQLQLMNQSLGLLSAEISDVKISSIALNDVVTTMIENEQINQEAAQKNSKKFFDHGNYDIYKSATTEEEYIDTLFGED